MTRPAGRRWPAVLVFVLALALAVGAVGWQGARRYAFADPTPGPVLPLTEPMVKPGLSVVVTGVRRAPSFPAQDAGDPPVTAPAGGEFVLVAFTAALTSPTATRDDALCDFYLIAPDGTRWSVESDLSYAIRRPAALSCSGSGGTDISPGHPVRGTVSFLVPASAHDLVLEVVMAPQKPTYRRRW